jgi:hypothetical protein
MAVQVLFIKTATQVIGLNGSRDYDHGRKRRVLCSIFRGSDTAKRSAGPTAEPSLFFGRKKDMTIRRHDSYESPAGTQPLFGFARFLWKIPLLHFTIGDVPARMYRRKHV